MKEIEKLHQDAKELHAHKQIEKKTLFLGSRLLRPGHRCFEINNDTKECKEAEFVSEVHFMKPNSRRIITKENHTYINALNIKNALKIYNRS